VFKRFAGSALLLIILAVGVYGATGLNLETITPVRYIYPPATETNPIEGYWYKSTTVTQAYVNYYPTGCAYTFILNCDSANTVARTGANFNPARIDIPLWKHFGVIGSYAFTVCDTGLGWITTDDSLFVMCQLRAIPASVAAADSLDTLFKNTLCTGVLIKAFLDSTDGKSPAEIDMTGTGVVGISWVASLRAGSIDLTDESMFYERARVVAMQAGANNFNSKYCRISLRMYLPYSTAYMQTDYYKQNQLVK